MPREFPFSKRAMCSSVWEKSTRISAWVMMSANLTESGLFNILSGCKSPLTRPASDDLVADFRPELSYRLDPEWISCRTIKRDRHLQAWQQQYRGCERGPRHGQEMGLPGRSLRFFKGFSLHKARISDRVAFPVKLGSGQRHRRDRVRPGAQLPRLAWLQRGQGHCNFGRSGSRAFAASGVRFGRCNLGCGIFNQTI